MGSGGHSDCYTLCTKCANASILDQFSSKYILYRNFKVVKETEELLLISRMEVRSSVSVITKLQLEFLKYEIVNQ